MGSGDVCFCKKLDNLVAVVDNNNLQIDGSVSEVNSPYPIPEKFAAFGWNVIEMTVIINDETKAAFNAAKACKGKPTAIIAKTVKGLGVHYGKSGLTGTALRRMRSSTKQQ